MADATLQTGQQSDVASRALTIAQALAHASTRERAETRRMGDEGAPFFWRMAARLGLRPDEERGRFEQPVVSEARLARLLAARGDLRLSALERAVRAICRETRALDAASLAWAVINPDGRQIARDYYRRLDGRAPVTKD